MPKPYVPYNGPIVTRDEARERGLKFYFTAFACQCGHVCERRTSTKSCVECDRIRARETYVPRQNQEKLLAGQARTAAKEEGRRTYEGRPCPKCGGTKRQVYSSACIRCVNECSKRIRNTPEGKIKAKIAACKSYIRNRDTVLARSKARRETGYNKRYYEENKQAILIVVKDWIKRNPERRLVYRQNRRAAGPLRLSPDIVQKIEELQNSKCTNCKTNLKKSGKHIDHIFPVALGGTSDPSNIQLLCPTCNRKKGAKDPIRWAQEQGRLL